MLRTTTMYIFATSQIQKIIRTWCALYILISKCASRHNGEHFFRHFNCQKRSEPDMIYRFWLRNVLSATTACNFSSLIWPAGSAPAALADLLFDPPEPQIIGKKKIAIFLIFFIYLHLLSSDSFSSDLLFSDLFSSDSSYLCFSTVHIIGNFISKFLSNIEISIRKKIF